MTKATIIGAALIVGFVAIGAVGWLKSLTPYVTIREARISRTTVQVKGALLKPTINVDRNGALGFTIVGDDGERMNVVYEGAKPGNLEQATHVVAVGRYDAGVFRAEQLIVKCPSKYQSAASGSK